MNSQPYSVIIIDDHPLIAEAYKTAFSFVAKKNPSLIFNIEVAEDCDTANEIIEEYNTNNKKLDIVFLDIKLPPSKDGKILSGEDLGIKIKTLLPKTKIVVSTTLNDNYRVHSIFKSINPDGFLIKNDITPKELIETINTIISDPPYYSKTVTKLLRKQISNNFLLDDIDRKILYELSIGTKMKELPEMIPLSLAGIEKRKRHLKQIFNITASDDKELLYLAKEKGFI
ncbi:response regulator [Polaribacter sp.]|uniref:response regulator n=1 Tax=Polaribacter sp. TaxID=1920175 RepID=UPI003EF525DA